MNVDGWAMSALDFMRAMNERPLIIKWLCRLFMGRYAYREFLFMLSNAHKDGFGPCEEYGLRDHDYHDDPQPWIWWQGQWH